MDKTIPYVVPVSQKPKVLTLVPKDATSRYKTRQLQVQVVGSSKMIKTLLINVLDVAKDMQIPPEYLGTFLGYELGVQSHYYAKKPPRQQAVISGEHSIEDLSKNVQRFVEEALLCPVCGLPEVLLRVEEPRVMGDCRACGASSAMPITNDRFRRYILMHAPATPTKGNAFDGNVAVAAQEEKKTESAPKVAPKVTKKQSERKKDGAEEGDVVWYSDLSDEAIRKRKEEMVPKLLDEVKPVIDSKEIKDIIDSSSADTADKLAQLQVQSGLIDPQFIPIFFSAVFSLDLDFAQMKKLIVKHKNLLHKFLSRGSKQLTFLECVESYLTENTQLTSKSAQVLQEFYSQDIIEEDSILQWHSSCKVATVKKNSAKFIEWLKNAEEESDEE